MRAVRQNYETDVPPELVQQTLDRIAAQTVDAPGTSGIGPRSRQPVWFGIGLAAGLALALLGAWPFLGGQPGAGRSAGTASSPAITVEVPDPARSAGNCVGFLLESNTRFAYVVDGDAIEVRFLGSDDLSANMKQWLLDRNIEPPAAGVEMTLRFVRSA
jgi:hypothetical protein